MATGENLPRELGALPEHVVAAIIVYGRDAAVEEWADGATPHPPSLPEPVDSESRREDLDDLIEVAAACGDTWLRDHPACKPAALHVLQQAYADAITTQEPTTSRAADTPARVQVR